AIVASSIPVAVGVAFSNKYQRNKKYAAVFFGDGAVDEGVFWESINFASLKKLPILFICEDNGFAVHTPRKERHGFHSMSEIISKFNCIAIEKETTDVETIYHTTKIAIKRMKESSQPCFLRFPYYRYLEHVGINEDFEEGYRSKKEFLQWMDKDPLKLQREKLLHSGVTRESLYKLEHSIDDMITHSIQLAQKTSFSDISETYKGVFRCEI
ncbi:MAG: thiamine pyrophosphate-dependent enzyme, partial [Thermodesulfobacteriota bacterium]|nr:thiamine pyrophosphate-dependent enzyme [Thermodesulfobacteriota bacterium]